MARKLLGFSCLVFLISIVYFIYTRYQLNTENKNQQEVTAELEAPSVGYVSTSRSSQPKTEDSNPEPTEEEWAAFEAFLSNLEELEELEGTTETIQPEGVAETEAYSAEGDDTGISPELEGMFIHYKEVFLNRTREVDREITPFMRRIVEIDERMEELFDAIMEKSNRGEEHQELLDARMQLYEERVEVSEALEPLDEQMAQIHQDWEEYLLANHGIDSTTFNETYTEALRTWFANQ